MSGAEWSLFVGRWHPVLVHLPIGLVIALVFLELVAVLRPRRAVVRAATGPLLALLIPTTLLAALSGWLLGGSGEYDAALLRSHRLSGLAVAVLTVLMGVAHVFRRLGWYRFLLVICTGVLIPAGHYGGSLTHGRDYLTRHAPSRVKVLLGARSSPLVATPAAPALDPAAFDVYLQGIQPVFDRYCVGCHGPERARGGLRLDHAAALWVGGDSGPALVPGDAEASLLLQRMRLPVDHEEHMPPAGKPQPDPADLELLAWWIARGAPTNRTLAEMSPPEPIRRRLLARPAATSEARPLNLPGRLPALEEPAPAEPFVTDPGVVITRLGADEPWLQVNAATAGKNFDDGALERLATRYGQWIRWLDLSGTAVTDAGLAFLSSMAHLERLQLDRTGVTDAGLVHLRNLVELESLNLYGTAVTGTGLMALVELPRLRRLYLWQTQVSAEAVQALLAARGQRPEVLAWQRELQELQRRLQQAELRVETGAPPGPSLVAPGVPVNTICPVSDKLVDLAHTLWHEGRLVAFCCGACRAVFAEEPARYANRLAQLANPPPGQLASPPANTVCPVTGRPVVPEITAVHGGRLLAFCCGDCRERFLADPARYVGPPTGSR